MRQTKKRKRERRKRKRDLPFKNAKNPRQLNHTTKLILNLLSTNRKERFIHSSQANGTEEEAKKKRKKKKQKKNKGKARTKR